MLKTIAMIFGIVMLALGILGFIPQATPDGLLLGLFHVNPPHNWIHILTGLAAILAGISGEYAPRLFFQIFGIVYALIAVIGFFYGDRPILGLIANNFADGILHVLIAAFALYLGFSHCCRPGAKSCCSGTKKHDDDSNVIPPRDRDV